MERKSYLIEFLFVSVCFYLKKSYMYRKCSQVNNNPVFCGYGTMLHFYGLKQQPIIRKSHVHESLLIPGYVGRKTRHPHFAP